MTQTNQAPTIAGEFAAWREEHAQLAALPGTTPEADYAAAVAAVYAVEDRALALPPLSVLDLYRKIVLALDPPAPGHDGPEARLGREARAALGLPLDWEPGQE